MPREVQEHRGSSSLFTQLDVSAVGPPAASRAGGTAQEQCELLRDIIAAQDRTNDLLEELLAVMAATQRQRHEELVQWRQANPALAKSCREAAEGLAQVQLRFLNQMAEEINASVEDMLDGEFVLTEFVDRFGPRLVHLNGVIQVLTQLSSLPNPADPTTPQ